MKRMSDIDNQQVAQNRMVQKFMYQGFRFHSKEAEAEAGLRFF